jgi:hypothetical protein
MVQVQNLSGGKGEHTKCPVTIAKTLNMYVPSVGDLQDYYIEEEVMGGTRYMEVIRNLYTV